MRRMIVRLVAAPAALALSACTGGTQNDEQPAADHAEYQKDCYAAVKLRVQPPAPARAVFVLVDQTTGLDSGLRATVTRNLASLLVAGTRFEVATFSATNKGRYATILGQGELQAPVPEKGKDDLEVYKLEALSRCLDQQAAGAKADAARQVAGATEVAASTFTNSEIVGSLTQLSQAVKASPARRKLVIVVSDLLEHSSVTSFYRNKDLRLIEPQAELDRIADARLVGDFGGASVAIVGAGLLSPESDDDRIRNAAALTALRDFWEGWFSRSRAELVQYGQPDLVTELRWTGEPLSAEAS